MKKLLTEWRKFLKEDTGGPLYHLSPIKFDKFQQQMATNPAISSDVGFHFGTKDTALTVADKLQKDGKIILVAKSPEKKSGYSGSIGID